MAITLPHEVQSRNKYHQQARHKRPDILTPKKLQKYWDQYLHQSSTQISDCVGRGTLVVPRSAPNEVSFNHVI